MNLQKRLILSGFLNHQIIRNKLDSTQETQETFTLSNDFNSPMYVNCNGILGNFYLREEVKSLMVSSIQSEDYFNKKTHALFSIATSANSLGGIIANELKIPCGFVRNKSKDHGLKNMIEGGVCKTKYVYVIEDTVTTGKSVAQAVNTLRDNEYKVSSVYSVFDYEFAEKTKRFEEMNIVHKSLLTFSDYLHAVPEEIRKTLQDWHNDPFSWEN